MAPLQCNAHKSSSPPANESGSSNGLLFITGNKPADFKARNVMTKVRKQAMGSYLQKEKKPRGQRARLQSEDSTGSRVSIGSDHQESGDGVISNREALKIWRGESRRPRKQSTSPVKSPASSGQGQKAPSPETQISRIPPSIDIILSSSPMVQPMRTGLPLPYMQTSARPFQSIGKPLDPFRTLFQAHHPRVSVEELKFHCSRFFGTRAMGQHWIPTLVKSPHAFLSTLCIASAQLDAVQNRTFESIQTTALRQEVIHLIGQNLLNPQAKVDDYNIIALTQLIASEVIGSDDVAIGYHEAGVAAMVKARGGMEQLGVNGRIASTLSWVCLESAILREAKSRSIYSDFCASTSTRTYPNTATIPESPLFCPREEFQTVERSPRCAPRTLDLLKDIRMMMDLFLHETKRSRQNSQSLKNLYKKITTEYPCLTDLSKNTILNYNDWTYEAIRLTSIIQATAIIKRIPISEALKYAAQTENPTSLYVSSASASTSAESLISPTNLRHDSPVTSFSTSPTYTTSPAYAQQNYFTLDLQQPYSRPSLSAMSTTSDITFFPPPPAPVPTGPAALLSNLQAAIENSDISDCWADMAGVLLWVGLVAGAASRHGDKVPRKWFSALAVRCSIMLCFEHPEPVHATLLKMGEVVEGLGVGEGRGGDLGRREKERESGGKRRRT